MPWLAAAKRSTRAVLLLTTMLPERSTGTRKPLLLGSLAGALLKPSGKSRAIALARLAASRSRLSA